MQASWQVESHCAVQETRTQVTPSVPQRSGSRRVTTTPNLESAFDMGGDFPHLDRYCTHRSARSGIGDLVWLPYQLLGYQQRDLSKLLGRRRMILTKADGTLVALWPLPCVSCPSLAMGFRMSIQISPLETTPDLMDSLSGGPG